ncbi:hypothetical protein BU26DRAFT_54081 [Trematosphaeria pertusa]|uniref:Secreted protein n=1 Tax=Trematosphaeria pertusa TaxID=390896 RepID=A0A6A6I8H1_9PLEO|nr:uncharacterized protein BU26DRAFT_54081 [Trematosphaeria pertusa]KAF2246855.1 hypothetical protein BU26DRAFT_54081 [Trematosphaeria pertusa]
MGTTISIFRLCSLLITLSARHLAVLSSWRQLQSASLSAYPLPALGASATRLRRPSLCRHLQRRGFKPGRAGGFADSSSPKYLQTIWHL